MLSDDEGNSDESSVYSGLEEEETETTEDEAVSRNEDSEEDQNENSTNEYENDSSDEEDMRNTVGDIPLRWYDDYPHIGYDWDGQKILKPVESDQLDEFINKMEDPNYWRTVRDKWTGQKVVLTDQDLQIIQNIQKTRYPDADYDPYQPFEDFFTYKTMIHPVTNRPDHKRSFLPSKSEKEKVSKMVYAIKMGWMKPKAPKKPETMSFFDLWNSTEQVELSKRMQHYIPAPKRALPGHEESYNPPPEYLLSHEELEKWKSQDPEDRRLNFIPQKNDCLRLVPGYANFTKEVFERCLDLYLCPRQRKMRVNVNPEDLIPKLPKPKDLQPFPTVQAMMYKGHEGLIQTISVDPSGQFVCSGSDDKTVRIWEVLTGRSVKKFDFEGAVKSLAWCPNESLTMIAASVGQKVYLLNPGVGSRDLREEADRLMELQPEDSDNSASGSSVEWHVPTPKEQAHGIRLIIEHNHEVKQVTWHAKGDYIATVTSANNNQSVIIHQLSKRRSQVPFRRTKGLVQKVLFHPLRPYFFVATQSHVRIYNLLKQQLSKKLLTNCKWLSSIDVHPQGDNVIIGSFDCRLCWFDLDLSVKPYKMLRHHKKAIRQVVYHKRYPLFASASDDGTIIICHGMVYSDLLQNPLIVPVKVLKGHQTVQELSVTDCVFHPFQPWIFSAGADATVRLFT